MPVYSHSRLSAYESCPLQYKYRYIDRIRTDFESIEAFMGKKVHEALETVYADLDGTREAGVEALVKRFHRLWSDALTPSVKVIRPDMTADDYLEIGERCVRGFWELNFPFRIEPSRIIGLEWRVDIALDKERRHRMMGYIDRVQHAEPGVIEIHDYKTSAKLPWKGSLADDRQLPLYEMGIRQAFPEADRVRLIWHFLAHRETFTETRTREQLDRIRRSCIALIQTVERAREFPAKKGPLCAWCSYQEMCPEWKDAKPVASPAFPEGRPAEAREPGRREGDGTAEEARVSPASGAAPGDAVEAAGARDAAVQPGALLATAAGPAGACEPPAEAEPVEGAGDQTGGRAGRGGRTARASGSSRTDRSSPEAGAPEQLSLFP